MSVDQGTVRRIAHLARIAVTDADGAALGPDSEVYLIPKIGGG